MFLERFRAAGFAVGGFDLVAHQGVEQADLTEPGARLREAVSKAELVLLSVPDAVACRAGADIAGLMREDALLVDCTSVKSPYVEAVGEAGECGLVSINPLFGPGLDWVGRSIVVTEIRPGPKTSRFETSLRGFGLHLIHLDAARHDALAAEAQAQLHASILSFIASASEDGALIDTPPNQVMRMMAARVLTGEPQVYWKIQTANPFAAKARLGLRETLRRLEEIIEADDFEAFTQMMEASKANLGRDAAELATDCADLFSKI